MGIDYDIFSAFYYEVKNCHRTETFTPTISRAVTVGVFKHWLSQTGNYNLDENMWLFNWMQEKKMRNINPFWALVALLKDDNNTETLLKKN